MYKKSKLYTFSNPNLKSSIATVQVVQRYDILMIQEIRDSAQTAFPELVDLVNRASKNSYAFVTSGRTGRSSNKEQYGYIYRFVKFDGSC